MIERGAIYRMTERGAYTGKPRPVVIMQNPNIRMDSIIVVPLTSNDSHGAPIRIGIDPNAGNGLRRHSFAMCDKVQAIRRDSLVEPPVGKLSDALLRQIRDTVYDLIDEGVALD